MDVLHEGVRMIWYKSGTIEKSANLKTRHKCLKLNGDAGWNRTNDLQLRRTFQAKPSIISNISISINKQEFQLDIQALSFPCNSDKVRQKPKHLVQIWYRPNFSSFKDCFSTKDSRTKTNTKNQLRGEKCAELDHL